MTAEDLLVPNDGKDISEAPEDFDEDTAAFTSADCACAVYLLPDSTRAATLNRYVPAERPLTVQLVPDTFLYVSYFFEELLYLYTRYASAPVTLFHVRFTEEAPAVAFTFFGAASLVFTDCAADWVCTV